MTRVASLALLSLALFAPAAADAAGAATVFRFSGRGIIAFHTESDSCSFTRASVLAFDALVRGEGPPIPPEAVSLDGEGYDCDTQTGFEFHSMELAVPDLFQFTSNMSSASLEATVPVIYCTTAGGIQTCIDTIAHIDLGAQAIAPPQVRNDHENTLSDGTRINEHSQLKERPALVSATITVDSLELPLQFEFSAIRWGSDGIITITPP